MKILLSSVLSLVAVAAAAHESLAPHQHPHGLSVLPDLGPPGIAAMALCAALIVCFKFRRGRTP